VWLHEAWAKGYAQPGGAWALYNMPGQTAGLVIQSGNTQTKVHPGDWIIRGEKGGLCVCSADVFALTYEPAAVSSPPGPFDVALAALAGSRHATGAWDPTNGSALLKEPSGYWVPWHVADRLITGLRENAGPAPTRVVCSHTGEELRITSIREEGSGEVIYVATSAPTQPIITAAKTTPVLNRWGFDDSYERGVTR
jgi:hypothetical protein